MKTKFLILACAALGMLACSDSNVPNENKVKIKDGALPGRFTINDNGDQIVFSQGNLQYQASTATWRFALNQTDYIGYTNSSISSTYSGWIDLFGWGTSGYSDYLSDYYPYNSGTGGSGYCNGNWQKSNDWGSYNAISNGGNKKGIWRTLTKDEWIYILGRADAINLCGLCRINNINGLIILPDKWRIPNGLEFYANGVNVYSISEWQQMEAAGAVFLPAAGRRVGKTVDYVGEQGLYWSAGWRGDGSRVPYLFFSQEKYDPNLSINNFYGLSVRLVKDVK